MSGAVGIDPGKSGAIALYMPDGTLIVADMPTIRVAVGRGYRERIDPFGLSKLLGVLRNMADVCVIEAVGGRPQQSAPAAFVFGYGTGLVYGMAVEKKFHIEAVLPNTWKRHFRIPFRKGPKGKDEGIINRACEIFPGRRDDFTGPKGGYKIDRAEAALMARFGYDVTLRRPEPIEDPSLTLTRVGGAA